MKTTALYCLLITLMLSLSSCEVVAGIFKAGMVWGILLVLIIVVTIVALITRKKS